MWTGFDGHFDGGREGPDGVAILTGLTGGPAGSLILTSHGVKIPKTRQENENVRNLEINLTRQPTMLHLISHRQSIGGQPPVPNPMRNQV